MHVGRTNFRHASTDVASLMADHSCNTAVIATAMTATRRVAGPGRLQTRVRGETLCLTAEELAAIEEVHTGEQLLMVGFNRRFAPLLIDLQKQLQYLVALRPSCIPATPVPSPLTTGLKIPLLVVVVCSVRLATSLTCCAT